MISVVIPLYNKEEFIEKTLRSVLEQTMDAFEVIIVNDGSTDNSVKRIEALQDSRIRLLQIQHSGVSIARNRGIKVAKYSWIAFLDADDWWAPDFLKEVSLAMEQFPNQKIFATGRTTVYENKEVRYENTFLPNEGVLGLVNYYEFMGHYLLPPINSSCAVISKTLLEEIGMFHEKQELHEDHDLWLRICNNKLIVYINKNLSFYRKDRKEGRNYDSKNFLIYLETLKTLKNTSSKTNKYWLLLYANKFILLTFIKYSSSYSINEKKSIIQASRSLLKPWFRFTLIILSKLPFNGYTFLKKIRRYGYKA
ncbi:MAG: glycosyltransferase family A protein [Flavobacteriaceae bacterium]